MRNACRPMGRFFCLLKWLAAVVAMAVTMLAQTNGPTMTQVADIVYRADGTVAKGTVLISWPAFTTLDGKSVAAGSSSVQLGNGGSFIASLAPNTGAQPAGVYYKVIYQLAGQEPSTEYWVVPATGSTTIGSVRAKLQPQTIAAQVLTRDVADTNYVHVAGDQTIGGVKTYAALESSSFQGIQYVCQQNGNDIGAKVQAAYNNLPLDSGGHKVGTMSFDGCSGYYSWTTPVTMTGARVKMTANSSASKIEMQCNITNCLTLNVTASAASSDGDNMSVLSGWEMDGSNSVTGQCGITVADVYNVAFRDLKFYGFSASGSSPICIQSNVANSTGVEGLKLMDVFFVDNYYGVDFANNVNSANGASFGYGEWTGVRWFSNVSGSAFVNLPSGSLHNTTIHVNANVNASSATVFRISGKQYGSGPGTALWLDKLYVVGECTSGCNGTATTFDLAMGTAATVWLDWHNSANLTLVTGAGTLTQLAEGAYDHQTITYAGHKPFCSGTTDPDLASIGGNYQACMLPYGSGSYVQGYSWNMTYDRANQKYSCPGDGTANGCSAALANNAGNINFVAIPFNGGATQNISETNILNHTVMKLDSGGTRFFDGITQNEVANIDTSGNATVQNLTVKGTCAGCGSGNGGGDLSSPPAIGGVTPNAATFTTLTSQVVNGIPNAARFGGADACAKINAAIGFLDAAVGGMVEARGFTAAELATACTNTLTIDRPVRLMLPEGVIKLGGNPGILISTYSSGVKIEGRGWEANYSPAAGRGTVLRSTSPYPMIVDNGASQGTELLEVELDGHDIGTFGFLGVFAGGMTFRHVHAHNFQYTGLMALGGVNSYYDVWSNNNGGEGMLIASDVTLEGNMQVALNGGSGVHMISAGAHFKGSDVDHNGLHGIYADGRHRGDWTASTKIIQPVVIMPLANNVGGYLYYSANVGGTTGATAPAWNQTPNAVFSDGSVTWVNIGNNAAARTMDAIAQQVWIEGGYVDDNGTATATYPGFVADNIRLEGDPVVNVQNSCNWNNITGTWVSQAGVRTATITGIHLINCYESEISGAVLLGSGYAGDSAPLTPDQGGLVVENSGMNTFSNITAHFQTRSAVRLIGAKENLFTNLSLTYGAANSSVPAPLNYAINIDASSSTNQFNMVNIDTGGIANSKGIYNRGGQTYVDNYQTVPGGTTALDDLQYATLTNAHGRTANVPVEFDVNGSSALAIDSTGRVTVGELSARDIPGHEYFVSKYASIQAAIDAAYNNGTVQGGATVVDDRLAPYTGPGFIVKDSVTVKLAATTYTIAGAVTYNNGVGNVTAGIISMPGSHIVGVGTSSNHGTIISAGAGLSADLIASSTLGTGTGANAQWWHWGSIESLNINGASQASGRCLVVENMGETARVENILARSCYGNNIEVIGSSASQSSIRNITTMRSQTASGMRFTNLSGVGKVDGLSGDCNPTSLVSVQENAAGSLTILGLKAEGEASICTGQVHDPVVLLDGVAGFNDHVRIIGGYAFGTAQGSFAKFVNAGNAILETEGLYITGYTNMLNDMVRGVTVPLSSSTSKQPFYYEPGGTTYANQAFTLTGGTFVQGQPATTPTEIFGLTTGSATLLAAAGNGDNSSILTGGIQISGQNRAQYGTPPEIMARWGYRWLGAGLGYDTTNFDLVPAWNSGDTSSRNLGNALTVCKKGSTTVSCRWPNIYALNVDTTSLTLNGSTVTIPTAGATTPNMDGAGAAGSSSNYARADHVHPSDTSRAAANASTTVNGVVCALGGSCTPPGSPVAYSGTGSVTMTNSGSTAYTGFPTTAISAGAMTADASYMVTVEVAETAPGVGTCAGTVNFSMAFKDPDTTTTYALNTVFFSFLSLSNVTSPVGSLAMNTGAKGAANTFTSIPRTLRMAAGTAVQFQFLQNAADGASCSTHPTFTWRVAIVGPLPY